MMVDNGYITVQPVGTTIWAVHCIAYIALIRSTASTITGPKVLIIITENHLRPGIDTENTIAIRSIGMQIHLKLKVYKLSATQVIQVRTTMSMFIVPRGVRQKRAS